MNISSLKSEYKDKKLSKIDFVTKMHELHKVLFDFSANLAQTEIQKIEIEDGNVFFISRPTSYHTGGVKFYIDTVDLHITPLVAFNLDQYESEDSELLFRLVIDGDTVFDIGANIGWYSNHLSKKFPGSVIYSFEPIPDTFAQLKMNTELNHANNIKLNNIAFSDTKKDLSFYYSPVIRGASSSVNITEDPNMVLLECHADTIDNFVAENSIGKLDFIKCDVEGAEFMVYKGGAATIEKYKPVIFSEMLRKWSAKFNYHPNDIIHFFRQFGYNCYTAHGGKLEAFDLVTEDTLETNYFFLHPVNHKDKIARVS